MKNRVAVAFLMAFVLIALQACGKPQVGPSQEKVDSVNQNFDQLNADTKSLATDYGISLLAQNAAENAQILSNNRARIANMSVAQLNIVQALLDDYLQNSNTILKFMNDKPASGGGATSDLNRCNVSAQKIRSFVISELRKRADAGQR